MAKEKSAFVYPISSQEGSWEQELGLTKREYFAGLALGGIMANGNATPTKGEHFRNIAEDAIRVADELLTQLNK